MTIIISENILCYKCSYKYNKDMDSAKDKLCITAPKNISGSATLKCKFYCTINSRYNIGKF